MLGITEILRNHAARRFEVEDLASISVAGGKIAVSVRISVAVAEYVSGEAPDQIFDRVDQLLYCSKATGPSQLVQLAEQLEQAQPQAVAS